MRRVSAASWPCAASTTTPPIPSPSSTAPEPAMGGFDVGMADVVGDAPTLAADLTLVGHGTVLLSARRKRTGGSRGALLSHGH